MKQKYSSYKLLALSSALSALSLTAAAQNANVVYQDSNVRFTLVTDGTVRMEYAPDGKFLDNKSFIAVNRSYPEVKYKKNETSKKVVISTDYLTLSYTKAQVRSPNAISPSSRQRPRRRLPTANTSFPLHGIRDRRTRLTPI